MSNPTEQKPAANAPEKPTEQTPEAEATQADEVTVDWTKPKTWPKEIGGSKGPEPTRYGDWESNGRCTDF